MGASSSKDTELDEALSKFDESEREMLEKLYDSLSGSETHFNKTVFKQHMNEYLPDTFCDRVFDVMHNVSPNQGSGKQINKRDFFISSSQILKGTLSNKAQALQTLTTSNNRGTLQELLELCIVLIESYTTAIKRPELSIYKHVGSNTEANRRLAKMLLKSIQEDKHQYCGVASNDFENWMRNEVLLVRLFEDVFKVCLFGPESIMETHPHGLQEGCEPTVEHVERIRKDILLPCKLDFQGHKIETMLDIPTMLMLNNTVPLECRHIWRLLFATSCHGKSFTSFLHRIVYQGPTILLVKDRDGVVFGGFASTSWKVRSSFQGDKDCFVFTVNPSMSTYHPTGINDHYMYLNVGMQTIPNGLGMGGQFEYFGMWLDSDFGPGHSKARPKSTTYGSPQLSGSEKFQVEDIEVWGVGAPPEQEEKQRSVLDTETDAQAILDLIGKERKSEGLREPEDSD